ncbi:MAG TPA: hypothetical protein VGG77_02820 [Roseiarcus sp.]
MHTTVDAVRIPRIIEACGRRMAVRLPVINPILPHRDGLGTPTKFPDAVRLGPVLRETQVVRHGLAIFGACRIVLGLRASGRAKSGDTERDRGAGAHVFSS